MNTCAVCEQPGHNLPYGLLVGLLWKCTGGEGGGEPVGTLKHHTETTSPLPPFPLSPPSPPVPNPEIIES